MAINKNIKSQFNRDYKNNKLVDIGCELLDNGNKYYKIILGEPIVKDNVTLKDLYKLIQVIDKKVDDSFKELKDDVKSIDNRLSNVENDVKSIDNRLSIVENDVKSIDNRLSNVEEDVKTLKSEAKRNGWNV